MKAFIQKKIRALALWLAAFGWAMIGPAFAVDLVAEQVTATMPDATVIDMWGFRDISDSTSPGAWRIPTISAVAGDTLTINLVNNLAGPGAEPVSIVIPGQKATESGAMVPTWTDGTTGARGGDLTRRVRSFTHEAGSGGGADSYEWASLKPGTYLIQSGTHPAVQMQMGLYAVLKVDVVAGIRAYGDGSTADYDYDSDPVLLFSEIDPALHTAVAAGTYGTTAFPSTMEFNPKYFLINGQPYSGTATPVAAGSSGDNILLRFLNAGIDNRVPVLQGGYMTSLAEDGYLHPFVKEQYSLLLAPGKTIDALWSPAAAGQYPLYDRRNNLTNAGVGGGGMLIYLEVVSPAGAPTADAGPDQLGVALDAPCPLDGSGSSDPDSPPDPLTYDWSLLWVPEGSTATLNNSTTVDPTFTPDIAGTYVARLMVNDGAYDSSPDTVTVITNQLPIADAGPDQSGVTIDGTVTLDGRGSSDPDGSPGPFTYSWFFLSAPAGSVAALSDPAIVAPTFTADVGGTYEVQLVVNDGANDSAPDTVTIVTNLPPTANAGPDQTVTEGDTVTLDGSVSSDPDGDALIYNWVLFVPPDGNVGSLDTTDPVHPTFGPAGVGTYTVQLVVTDGELNSSPDTATITAYPAFNAPPVAANDSAGTTLNTPVDIVVLDNDTDPDYPIDPTTVAIVGGGTTRRGGTAVPNVDGSVTYTPAAGFRGTDEFWYTVSDIYGAVSNEAKVRIRVRR